MAATDQVQIVVPDVQAAPLGYTVPGGQAVQPLAVNATFDGSGAGSAFLPTLELVSDSGHVIARCPVGSSVAAGASAEVSWFPRVAAAAAATPAAAASPVATSPQFLPILSGTEGFYDGSGWTFAAVDSTVRYGAVRVNSGGGHTAALGDYFTMKLTLGPMGSIWAGQVSYRKATDGGQFQMLLASVASPNPNRPAPNEGTLTDNPLTYVTWSQVVDTYAAGPPFDEDVVGFLTPFRILGADGAALSAFTPGGDTYTGFATMDGGAGVYELKVLVTGQNGASTGFACGITSIAFLRLDDLGFL